MNHQLHDAFKQIRTKAVANNISWLESLCWLPFGSLTGDQIDRAARLLEPMHTAEIEMAQLVKEH